MIRKALATLLCLAALPAAAQSVPCGGNWNTFLQGVAKEAVAQGRSPRNVDQFLSGLRQDPKVIAADRRQGVFQLDFTSFARRLISKNRLNNGRKLSQSWDRVFDQIERDFGVPRGVLLAFWAFETDYGGYQGDFNTANALATLAHDCRRPELFRPQLLAAVELYEHGDFDPRSTTGAWAGEIGMVQMLPRDILQNGVDGDGDGHVRLKTSAPDALMSGAQMLRHLGWRANEPWLQEVTLPTNMDWGNSGLDTTFKPGQWQRMGVMPRSGNWQANLPASLILPQGRNGPAFIAYPNFSVLFEWNQSFTYVLTAAYFATRLSGAPVFNPGNPDPGLSEGQMKALQRALAARGYDVGDIDGILGAGTRAAVREEQDRLGLPADAWPTKTLLNAL